ncbi:primosomal protein N' (replication factor Y) [Desulfobaculum xiamenense]|uniref:Replication restart protein PriA n=1 Tax=Desulfobaculum xiamenense TaxID=995050 RepID=A0A846QGN2_9BACT|nr:primosomal protein N' [Desulfobaculum xiamenense]NJB67448.1 primosomal protein N' (replication factor Y) [Desulfobaculum xiamenense]
MKLWHVALPCAPFSILTYAHPACLPAESIRPGQRVVVPLGRSTRLGIVVREAVDAPPNVTLREIVWPAEREALLDARYMELADNLATRQMSELGKILEALLPAAVRSVRISFRVFDPRYPARLSGAELGALCAQDRVELARLWDEGRMQVVARCTAEKEQEYCFLTQDPPWPVRPSAKRQIEVLEYLWDNGPTSRTELVADLGSGVAQALNTLVANAVVSIGPPPVVDEPEVCAIDVQENVPELSAEQSVCLDDLYAALDSGQPATRLVFGVTGSGKTLVYLKLAERALASGRSVLLLAPEVALACHLYKAVVRHFPGLNVRLYHGYQQPSRREDTFRELAASAGPELVVGTRSALFLPVGQVGLIVLDEEHDSSFKQEERLPYQAKEVAHFRARQDGALLVLGSATPDVKTFQAVEQGLITSVCMEHRVGDGTLPEIALVDLRNERPSVGPLTPTAAAALTATVKAGDQAIIMLNRRGYAPLMYCLDCGAVMRCPHCDVGLTYHKNRERLVCHYCGESREFPCRCTCGGSNFLPMGEGTESIEETLNVLLPAGTGVLRLDRDSTRRPGRMEEILDSFARQEAQVLVGTQMLSKGHHFPNVTLVAVPDGDMGLNLPDYRAAERTFQLLVQVAGRAGRGEKPGRVLIQTRDPNHYCWKFVRENDYRGFFAREVELRRKYGYPPFTRLGLVRMSHPVDWAEGETRIMELGSILMDLGMKLGVRVLGPAPSPLAMLRGRKRYQCLLKGKDWPSVRRVFAHLKSRLSQHSKIRVSLDLDPVNML